MNSKAKILERIARDGMPEYPYPQFDFTPQRFDDRAATFAERLAAAGGRAVWVEEGESLAAAVRRCYPEVRQIALKEEGIDLEVMPDD